MAKVKRSWIIVGAIAVVLLIGFFVVQHLLDADTYRGKIEGVLTDSLGRPTHLGHLDFSLFSGSLVAESPSIDDDPAFSKQPFLTAKDVRIGVEVGPLIFHRQIHITGFTITEPKITLLRAENGTWNYSSIGGEGKRKAPTAETSGVIPNLTVAKIDIKNGAVSVSNVPATGKPHVYSNLNIGIQNFAFEKAFPFTVTGSLPAGGSLDVKGTAGPINQHDASLTPVTAQLALKHGDLVGAGLVDEKQGISGIADLDTKVVSNGQTAQANGTLQLTQLKLAKNGTPSAQPVNVQFALNQNLQALSGSLQNTTVRIGKSVAVGIAGTYQSKGAATNLQINANGQNMAIDELTAFLPSLGVQLPSGSRLQGGTVTTTLNVSGPTTGPVITGPVRIANTQLAGFDLGQKLQSLQALGGAKTGSNTTIQSLSTDLRYGPEGVRTDNLAVVVAGLGSATGSGSISAANALNYRLVVKLSSGGVAGMATQALSQLGGFLGNAASQTAKNGIPVTIAGTTANPTFTPDLSKVMGGAVKKPGVPANNPLGKALGGLFPR